MKSRRRHGTKGRLFILGQIGKTEILVQLGTHRHASNQEETIR